MIYIIGILYMDFRKFISDWTPFLDSPWRWVMWPIEIVWFLKVELRSIILRRKPEENILTLLRSMQVLQLHRQ